MRTVIHAFLLCAVLHYSYGFTKYGRSCNDIGCPSNQVCVMSEDPCSYYNRGECGMYPSCKATGEAASCATHICPPTQECTLDNGTPKCVAQKSSSTHVHKSENTGGGSPSYPPQNPAPNAPSYPAQNPSYPAQNPSYPSGSLYPSISTPKPAGGGSYPAYPSQGSGGSAYPGYPSQGGGGSAYPGYPAQSGYPSYPQQGYNNNNRGGYPQYSGYPQYPNQGYPQSQYPGYQQPNNRGGSGSNSGSNPIVDKITDQLKTIGAGILKNALSNVLSGGNSRQ